MTPTWACAAASARCRRSTGGPGPSTSCHPALAGAFHGLGAGRPAAAAMCGRHRPAARPTYPGARRLHLQRGSGDGVPDPAGAECRDAGPRHVRGGVMPAHAQERDSLAGTLILNAGGWARGRAQHARCSRRAAPTPVSTTCGRPEGVRRANAGRERAQRPGALGLGPTP